MTIYTAIDRQQREPEWTNQVSQHTAHTTAAAVASRIPQSEMCVLNIADEGVPNRCSLAVASQSRAVFFEWAVNFQCCDCPTRSQMSNSSCSLTMTMMMMISSMRTFLPEAVQMHRKVQQRRAADSPCRLSQRCDAQHFFLLLFTHIYCLHDALA